MIMSINLSDRPSLESRRAGGLRKSILIATRPRSFAVAAVLVLAATAAAAAPSLAQDDTPSRESKAKEESMAPSQLKIKKTSLDHSGRKRVGMASYYARQFSGRQMADGTPMKPESDNAASRTLPLGTTAKVTSIRDGKTAVVTIRDRGPYAKGRIIDLSPRTARQLGIIEAGVTQVEVTPMTIPQPNGTVKSVVAMSAPETADAQHAAAQGASMTCPAGRTLC